MRVYIFIVPCVHAIRNCARRKVHGPLCRMEIQRAGLGGVGMGVVVVVVYLNAEA